MMSLFALATAVTCGAPLGAEELWKEPQARVLMLGEVHGTNVIPKLAGALLCASITHGSPVALALEAAPEEGQAALDRYLASEGGAADLAALRRAPMWLPGAPRLSYGKCLEISDPIVPLIRLIVTTGDRQIAESTQ